MTRLPSAGPVFGWLRRHATPELLPWLRNTAEGRISAAQFSEVERITDS